MDFLGTPVEWLALAAFLFLLWYGLLPLWMYNRVKGIERALWAVVTQLKQIRSSLPDNDPVQKVIQQSEKPPFTGHVKQSMFGR